MTWKGITTMRIKLLLLAVLFSSAANAEELHDHGNKTFHKFQLEADRGYGRDEMVSSWHFKGWIGKDRDKLALKSEGEKEGRQPPQTGGILGHV